MSNKHLPIIISIFLIALWLSGCQQSGTPLPDFPTTNTPAPTRTPRPTRTPTPTVEITIEPSATPVSEGVTGADLAGVTVKFWHPWTEDTEYALLTLINEFNAENPFGIVVTGFSQGSDMYNNVRAAIGSNNLPHITVGYNNQIQSWDNLSNGKIVDANQYVDDPEWGLTPATQADFYPAIWTQDTNTNKRLGLPVYRSGIVIFYNQTWAQELGFEAPPQTLAELQEQACAAAAPSGAGP